jgi:hypothetical protein
MHPRATTGSLARFMEPYALAVSRDGLRLMVADKRACLIRHVRILPPHPPAFRSPNHHHQSSAPLPTDMHHHLQHTPNTSSSSSSSSSSNNNNSSSALRWPPSAAARLDGDEQPREAQVRETKHAAEETKHAAEEVVEDALKRQLDGLFSRHKHVLTNASQVPVVARPPLLPPILVCVCMCVCVCL